MRHVLHRYRCARPILLYGRVLSTGEIVRLPPADAAEHVESGHLVEVVGAVTPANGTGHPWAALTTRN